MTISPSPPALHSEKREFLLAAISDVQETLRFTESKAGVIAVVLTIAASALAAYPKVGDVIGGQVLRTTVQQAFTTPGPGVTAAGLWLKLGAEAAFLTSAVLVALAVFMAAKAVVPVSQPVQHIDGADAFELDDTQRQLFFPDGLSRRLTLGELLRNPHPDVRLCVSLPQYASTLGAAHEEDLNQRLMKELLLLSYIRTVKTQRVTRALRFVRHALFAFGLGLVLFYLKALFNLGG
ncbi:hypothetical protein L1280_003093 [Deinococcus sp. HSC-46F16]|uniref:hypothetical protein n=1 Tax=Deinococcus sp. HSC-46F16 TaxID=2910968 RepID=UPI00209F9083|nr:hypothetical protein [Deinococcus sp. HSC-46F16]MCP2015910.1 hypothetical protein [Deinococcus sp. HSC-46F16]